jgi:hypothetical protein
MSRPRIFAEKPIHKKVTEDENMVIELLRLYKINPKVIPANINCIQRLSEEFAAAQ